MSGYRKNLVEVSPKENIGVDQPVHFSFMIKTVFVIINTACFD